MRLKQVSVGTQAPPSTQPFSSHKSCKHCVSANIMFANFTVHAQTFHCTVVFTCRAVMSLYMYFAIFLDTISTGYLRYAIHNLWYSRDERLGVDWEQD